MLMLGVLKCRATTSGMDEKYALFEERKRTHITNYNNVLKAHFMREKGISGGERAYSEFTTRLGNGHAAAPPMASLCQMTDMLLSLAVDASDTELPMLARNFSEMPVGVGQTCGTEAVVPPAPVAEGDAVVAAVAVAPVAAKADIPPNPQSAAAALEAAAAALQSAAANMKAQTAATMTAKPAEAEMKPAVMVQNTPAS
ncbi:MAG TPA: hypothetical protein VF475_01875 [Sphingobium sp.]